MATPSGPVPSPQAILRLYGTTLRAARAFSSYNFRQYFVRRTKSAFRELQVRFEFIAFVIGWLGYVVAGGRAQTYPSDGWIR